MHETKFYKRIRDYWKNGAVGPYSIRHQPLSTPWSDLDDLLKGFPK